MRTINSRQTSTNNEINTATITTLENNYNANTNTEHNIYEVNEKRSIACVELLKRGALLEARIIREITTLACKVHNSS